MHACMYPCMYMSCSACETWQEYFFLPSCMHVIHFFIFMHACICICKWAAKYFSMQMNISIHCTYMRSHNKSEFLSFFSRSLRLSPVVPACMHLYIQSIRCTYMCSHIISNTKIFPRSLRLSPVVPAWFLNIAAPLTSISTWQFALATLFGSLPASVCVCIYIYIYIHTHTCLHTYMCVCTFISKWHFALATLPGS